jgi:hypothetical protein
MGVIDDILPPDRSDAAPITAHLRGLLQELRREGAEAPRITITLDADAWSALELQFRRPFRPHSSYKYLPLDVGVVAFERRREANEEPPIFGDRASTQTPARQGALLDRPVEIACAPMPWQTGRVNFLGESGPTPEAAAAFAAARAHDAAWTPDAIEAKAALLEGERTVAIAGISSGPRPSDAIYSAPMVHPMTEISGKVDVAGYGGPWKEPT